jgi:glycosyltransferase involved in cell wall biosynthesis
MEKVLIVASVASMLDQFNMVNIKVLMNMGYEVHVAANFKVGNNSTPKRLEEFKSELDDSGIQHYHVDIPRSISISKSVKAYKQLEAIVEKVKYKFIHCHSPIGGVLVRLLCNKHDIRCIYTAHGFHFYKGASWLNWAVYYSIEKYLARYTDILITINHEDFEFAKRKIKAKKVLYTHGIGVDIGRLNKTKIDVVKKRQELGISPDAFIILSVGELNDNKNHSVVLNALETSNIKNYTYVICGVGKLKESLENQAAQLNIESNLKLLGFRTDIAEIYSIADMFVFPS